MTKPRRSFSIKTIFPVVMVVLVLFAVIPVIVTSYVISRQNSNILLSQRAELIVDGIEREVRNLLDPVTETLRYAQSQVDQSDIRNATDSAMDDLMRFAMAGTPQIFGMGIIMDDGNMVRWERESGRVFFEQPESVPLGRNALAERDQYDEPVWVEPFFSIVLQDTILNPRVLLENEGRFIGILTAGVTGKNISDYLSALSTEQGAKGFVLHGRDEIIAYPGRQRQERPETISSLDRVGDSDMAELAVIWDVQNPLTQTSRMERTDGHWSPFESGSLAYFYREIEGYSSEPLLIGVIMPSSESFWFRWAPTFAAGLGGMLMLLAAFAAWMIGRRIAAPVAEIDKSLSRFKDMDFSSVAIPALENSRVSEWRQSASSLRATADALQGFRRYVPLSLARRLLKTPQAAVEAVERDVTVMFADLEGFTEYASRVSASDAADHLNKVFALVGPLIEAREGVIDKYTGDGLMAFWGAPEERHDHAALALAAAQEISNRINALGTDGWPADAPRLRIGLHSGPAIAGNLGYQGRQNYTLVGDTVNKAERVEASLKTLHPGERVIIGISGQTASRSGLIKDAEPATIKNVEGLSVFVL